MTRGNIIPLAILCLVNGLTVVSSAIKIYKCCNIGESFEDFTLEKCASREIGPSQWPVFKNDKTLQFLTNPEFMNVNMSTTDVEVKYDPDKVISTSNY